MPKRATRRGARIISAVLLASLGLTIAVGGASAKKTPAQSSGPMYTLSFSPNHPKYSTALTINLSAATQPTSVSIQLPAGVVINAKHFPLCTDVPTCEPSTQVGSGSATVTYNGYVIPLSFEVFNRTGGLAIVINNPNGSPVVVEPTLSGSTLTIQYPNGTYKGLPIVVDKISLTFDQAGSGASAYVRTPTTCPKGGWISQGTFTFSTGSTSTVKASATCAAVKKKTKKKKTNP